jgi:acetyl esterase/lipase
MLTVFLIAGCSAPTPTLEPPTSTPTPPTNTPEPTATPAYAEERDLVYGKGGDVELKLNLARPASGNGPFPALVFLFRGGFASGSKEVWSSELREAAKRGYVAVAIDYRLTRVWENGKPKYPFPAQIHDGKCAIRWLRANAREYKIDANRIGVVGMGAGGNLALMLGLTDPSDGLEDGCGDDQISSRVQAIVNLAGTTDAVLAHQIWPQYCEPLLGGAPEQVPERYKKASPLTYVSKDDPPVLTIVGTRDRRLPQHELLDDRMKAVGASHTLIVKEGVGESVSVVALANFYEDNPAWDFLDKHLKNVGE